MSGICFPTEDAAIQRGYTPLRSTPHWWWVLVYPRKLGECAYAYEVMYPKARMWWAVVGWTWTAVAVVGMVLGVVLERHDPGQYWLIGSAVLLALGAPFFVVVSLAIRAGRGAPCHEAVWRPYYQALAAWDADRAKGSEWPGEPRRPRPLRCMPRWWWAFAYPKAKADCESAYFMINPPKQRWWGQSFFRVVWGFNALFWPPIILSAYRSIPPGLIAGGVVVEIASLIFLASMRRISRARWGAQHYDVIKIAAWKKQHQEWESRVAALKEAQEYAGRLPG